MVFIGAGCALLVAAGLKVRQLHHDPFVTDPLLPTRSLMIAAVGYEFVLGVWLISGVYPAAARGVAAITFGLFGVVSFIRAMHGDASCGCFGHVRVTPWAVALADACAVAALLALPVPPHRVARGRRGALVVSVLVAAGAVAWGLPGEPKDRLLVVEPLIVKLGEVQRGQQKTAVVRVTNPGVHPIIVSDIRTSCPCLTGYLATPAVPAYGSTSLVLEFDSSREPDFTGHLLITAEGLEDGHRPLFRVTVALAVE